MLKPMFKFLLLFVITAILSVAAATTAFIITKNILSNNQQSNPSKTDPSLNTTYVAAKDPTPEPSEVATYIVRLEGDSLNVYASNGENEEFLYNTTVYTSNLTPEDISLLSSGVTLSSPSQLTGFMEDYTS